VHNIEGDTTFCPGCKSPLIVRDWYQIKEYHLTIAATARAAKRDRRTIRTLRANTAIWLTPHSGGDACACVRG